MSKMEVLPRPAGGLQSQLRIISDSSLTMSFSLPSSFLQNRKNRSTSIPEAPNFIETALEDVGETWEERDWDTQAIQMENASTFVRNADTWEEETTPDLPDDFPRLIVNLTRIQRHHFLVTKEEEKHVDIMEVFHRIKSTLHEHFSQLAESFFKQKLCFHCTYGTSRTLMDNLHAAYPTDTFAMMDYPTKIDNVPLHEYLHTLSNPSKWKSVEYLKNCLRRCSRDIRWKRDITTELEILAEQEFMQYEEKLQRLSDEIDELSRLRDSFRTKLTNLDSKKNSHYLMLRRLEDIEIRLETLLDEYLKEPELEEKECYSAFGNIEGEGGVQAGMNVLDMVIAMIFCRLPRDFSQDTTVEEHFRMLFDHHIHILRLWKKDFGRLPPQSRAASARNDGFDSDRALKQTEEQVTSDVSEKQEESFPLYCRVDGGAFSDDSTSIKVVDDGQSLLSQYNESGYDKLCEGEVCDNDDLDGYGADYDSDDSEDEEQTAGNVKLEQNAESLKHIRVVKGSTGPHRRHVERTSRRSKQLQKVMAKQCYHEQGHDDASFQPFARTGAVKLLRLAKESEMF